MQKGLDAAYFFCDVEIKLSPHLVQKHSRLTAEKICMSTLKVAEHPIRKSTTFFLRPFL